MKSANTKLAPLVHPGKKVAQSLIQRKGKARDLQNPSNPSQQSQIEKTPEVSSLKKRISSMNQNPNQVLNTTTGKNALVSG